jgi:hypothetical protein
MRGKRKGLTPDVARHDHGPARARQARGVSRELPFDGLALENARDGNRGFLQVVQRFRVPLGDAQLFGPVGVEAFDDRAMLGRQLAQERVETLAALGNEGG